MRQLDCNSHHNNAIAKDKCDLRDSGWARDILAGRDHRPLDRNSPTTTQCQRTRAVEGVRQSETEARGMERGRSFVNTGRGLVSKVMGFGES